MIKIKPFFIYELDVKQKAALVRLRENRLLETDGELILEALFRITNPYPNTHCKDSLDTAFLNGRREVLNIFNSICDEHILTTRSEEDLQTKG